MKVFVAHTEEDAALATDLGEGLRAHGFSVSVGAQVSQVFSEASFADKSVERAIRSADCMLAISTVYTGFKYIVPEMAFFAGNRNFLNTVVVTEKDCVDRIPRFLLESPVILADDHDATTLLSIVVGALRTMHQPEAAPQQQVFVSYSRVDAEPARKIRDMLLAAGHRVWFDESSLIGGQDWGRAIEAAIQSSGAYVSLLSRDALGKRGVFQRELRQALLVAEEMPPGAIFIIPVVLDFQVSKSLPTELAKYHCIMPGDLLRALDFALGTELAPRGGR